MTRRRKTRAAVCEHCGAGFAARLDTPGRFCTVLCARKHGAGTAEHPNFKGGLCRSSENGRWVIVCRDGSLLLYSRAVMAAEMRRLLRSDEVVHHVNGNVEDDRPENLEVMSRAEHIALHRADLLAAKAAA